MKPGKRIIIYSSLAAVILTAGSGLALAQSSPPYPQAYYGWSYRAQPSYITPAARGFNIPTMETGQGVIAVNPPVYVNQHYNGWQHNILIVPGVAIVGPLQNTLYRAPYELPAVYP